MAGFKDYLTICNSGPSEFLAAVALRHRDHLTRQNLEIVRRNAGLLDAFFARHEDLFDWTRPRAGSVAFPRYLGAEGSERFCEELVERAGVLLLPSRYFGFGDGHFRIGLGRRSFPEGLTRLEDELAARRGQGAPARRR